MQLTRRRFLRAAALAAAAAGFGYYSFRFEPRRLTVERRALHLDRLPPAFDGFRIAHLTDLHLGPNVDAAMVRAAVQHANDFRPDLVALTGDFVAHPFGQGNGPAGARHAEPCAGELARLKSTFGSYAVLGNHDHWNDAGIVTAALEERGIPVLANRALPLERDGARLWLVGTDDAFVRRFDLDLALLRVPQRECAILLAHEPDVADDVARYSVDLQLSGHSHGGQVKLPLLGPPILPALARKYPEGHYRIGPLQLYTNRGVGLINPPLRFNCPAEVALLTLRARA